MCGIFASVGFAPHEAHIDVVAHRGPDGRGWKVFDSPHGPVALGHRRLSIIDVGDRAAQPMPTADGRYWLTYNGEIYNYLELKDELRARGVTFNTSSDSEVLLRGYVEWGEAVLDRLVGMYAFVIYDVQDKILFAARDRFGIKPLVYFLSGRGLAFGSEIKQLTELAGFRREVNVQRAWDFMTSGITDHTDETLFAGVRQVKPGCAVRLDFARWRPGQTPPVRRYYSLPENDLGEMTERAASERFRELLSEAVRLHLRSDVRVGSCLSGGLDSSAIVSLMARQFRADDVLQPVHTVSAVFPNKEVDERPFMDAVVAETGAQPHWVFPKPEDVLEKSQTITWHQDEPFGSTSIYAQWCVFERARAEGIKVMLDGQGADEQLAGYHSAFAIKAADLAKNRRWAPLARQIFERKIWHGLSFRRQIEAHLAPTIPALRRLAPAGLAPAQHPWWESEFLRANAPTSGSTFNEAIIRERLTPVDDLSSFCRALTSVTNLPMLLRFEDRNSMAHSIEARVPFLDHRLVEFNISLGNQHKVVGGDTKRVLRAGMRGIMPEKVRRRRDKLGFATPEQSWFRGPLRPVVQEGIENALQSVPGLVEEKHFRSLAKEMLDGVRPMDNSIWRLINFATWKNVFQMSM